MAMTIYVNGKCMGTVNGCELVGQVWVAAQRFAETIGADCALVSAETGEVVALWEP